MIPRNRGPRFVIVGADICDVIAVFDVSDVSTTLFDGGIERTANLTSIRRLQLVNSVNTYDLTNFLFKNKDDVTNFRFKSTDDIRKLYTFIE
jgi:hypothetical protein